MGKALIFSGVIVDNPLQTVNFIKELVTADDYINEYAKLATAVTSEQKNYLKTFIETLMNNGLWDKVKCCFPMLGGLNGYNKDLKDVFNQRTWNTPTEGTSWDSTRNAPYLNLPGNAKGTPLVIENMDRLSSSFLFSTKLKTRRTSCNFIQAIYSYYTENKFSIISRLRSSNGGYAYPIWDIEKKDENLSGYSYGEQANNIYMVTLNNGTNSMFVCSNNSTLLTGGTGATPESAVTKAQFAFGGFFGAEQAAPADNTLNGIMNMFIAFDSALTKEEWKIVSKAVWDFDEACGRHINF